MLNQQQRVIILVRGIAETFSVKPGTSLYIGRFQHDNQINIDLDLAPYGAARRGVSRVHLRLDVDFFRHLFITDLGSTNGTFFVGQRLEPHMPILIRDGDEVVLGNLPLKICFG